MTGVQNTLVVHIYIVFLEITLFRLPQGGLNLHDHIHEVNTHCLDDNGGQHKLGPRGLEPRNYKTYSSNHI